MLKTLILGLAMFLSCLAYSQNSYVWLNSQKRNIPISKEVFYISDPDTLVLNQALNLLGQPPTVLKAGEHKDHLTLVTSYWKVIRTSPLEESLIQKLRSMVAFWGESMGEKKPIPFSQYFYIRVSSQADYSKLYQIAKSFGIASAEPIDLMPEWVRLECPLHALTNKISLVNQIFEEGSFASVDYGFLVEGSFSGCASDSRFGDQYALENLAKPEFDVKACGAWGITKGNKAIKVAVVDQRIDFSHVELDRASISDAPMTFDTQKHPAGPYQFDPKNPLLFNHHGTHVAGIIYADKDKNKVSGIAPDVDLMGVGNGGGGTTFLEDMARGITWAYKNGASVINNSWGVVYEDTTVPPPFSPLLEEAIKNAITKGRGGLGTVVVFAAGNESGTVFRYPVAVDPDILTVGAIDDMGYKWNRSCYGAGLDVCAPGVRILSTIPNDPAQQDYPNGVSYDSGTSMAAPMVSGIAALVLSERPFLTGAQVRDIIEQSCHKLSTYTYGPKAGRPNGNWDDSTGYGLVDAHAALLLSHNYSCNTTSDLYIGDQESDLGIQPSPSSEAPYASPNIWIRNQDDGLWEHDTQNPTYGKLSTDIPPQQLPSYVYVRIQNRGCNDSDPNSKITIHWANASTGLLWKSGWVYTVKNGLVVSDQLVDAKINEAIKPGCTKIMKYAWFPPDIKNFAEYGDQRDHFCFLARINDGSSMTEVPDVKTNTVKYNNIAWKNVTVVKALPPGVAGKPFSTGRVRIHNVSTTNKTTKLRFQVPNTEAGTNIIDKGGVLVNLGMTLYNRWVAGGSLGQDVEVIWDTRLQENIPGIPVPVLLPILKIKSADAYIDNIELTGDESFLIAMEFGFTSFVPTSGKNRYIYDLIQYESNGSTDELIGGERYVIDDALSQTIYGLVYSNVAPNINTDANPYASTQVKETQVEAFKVYPNPTRDNFRIDTKFDYTHVRVYDAKGIEITTSVNKKKDFIEFDRLPVGRYFISIDNAKTGELHVTQFEKL